MIRAKPSKGKRQNTRPVEVEAWQNMFEEAEEARMSLKDFIISSRILSDMNWQETGKWFRSMVRRLVA